LSSDDHCCLWHVIRICRSSCGENWMTLWQGMPLITPISRGLWHLKCRQIRCCHIIYGSSDPIVWMDDKECTYYFHKKQSMDKHTKQLIKSKLQDWHVALCYEYNNSTSLEEVEVWYITIRCWWYLSKVANEGGLVELDNWLTFWHFLVRR
jgi:hypothetical protein